MVHLTAYVGIKTAVPPLRWSERGSRRSIRPSTSNEHDMHA